MGEKEEKFRRIGEETKRVENRGENQDRKERNLCTNRIKNSQYYRFLNKEFDGIHKTHRMNRKY